ncbi:hypothetical protein JCM10212_001717 [Sporobolomyces blumeae]
MHALDVDLTPYSIPETSTRSTPSPGGYVVASIVSTAVYGSTPVDEDDDGSIPSSVRVVVVVEPVWLGGIPESMVGTIVAILVGVAAVVGAGTPQRIVEWLRRPTRDDLAKKGE